MKLQNASFLLTFLGLIVIGCSTQKNNVFNREYHALNTKFNVLFNGKEALAIGEAILYQNNQDNFLEVLPVEPILLRGEDQENRASIPSFSVAEEKSVKAIQKHSMKIAGQQRNRQIQDAYLLLGKARYFDRRFLPALEAFNFLLEGYYGNEKVYYEGKLWREKTNLRLGNYALVVDNLKPLAQRIPFGTKLYPEVNATVAQAFLNLKNEDSARVYISKAALAEKDRTAKARYRYIEAQLLEKAHLLDSARQAFQSIVNWKRKSPRIFWMQAKLQAIRLRASLDSVSPRPILERLAKQFENQPYLHLIHQQEARYLLSQKEDSLAIEFYNKSLQSPGVDPATRMANYRELADYYFENGVYLNTGAYLDSLLRVIPEEGRLKKTIQRERDGLDEVIALETIIRSTDSILSLTALSKEEQFEYYQQHIDRKRAKELGAIEEEKKGLFSFNTNASNNFYFYNNRLLVSGRQAFLSSWGNRPNADNWNKLSTVNQVTQDETAEEKQEDKAGFFIDTPSFFVDQLPTDSLAIAALEKDRKQAYLDVGILYKEKFDNPRLAFNRLKKVFTLNPTENQEVRALYHCFKLLEQSDTIAANGYKTRLLEQYPDSPFTQIVRDPANFSLAENQTPASVYERLYKAFERQEFQKVLAETESLKIVVSGTKLSPKVTYLQALSTGRLQGEIAYIVALQNVVELHPNSSEAELAKQAIKQLDQEEQLKHKRLTLKSYKWVFSFEEDALLLDRLVKQMQDAIKADQKAWKFTRDVYNKTTNFIVVHTKEEQPNQAYFLEKWRQLPDFDKKTNNFVLLSAQYEQVQRLKTWETISNQPQQ